MMMLVTNSRIREVMTRVAAQVQAAGIDPAAAKVKRLFKQRILGVY